MTDTVGSALGSHLLSTLKASLPEHLPQRNLAVGTLSNIAPVQKSYKRKRPKSPAKLLPRSQDEANGKYSSLPSSRHHTRRPARAKYCAEEIAFIQHHRLILKERWNEITERFGRKFRNRPYRSLASLQSMFYRSCKETDTPKWRYITQPLPYVVGKSRLVKNTRIDRSCASDLEPSSIC